MNRRLAISEDMTVQILLTLPTLLHPSLDELKNLVKSAAEHETCQWSPEKGLDVEIKVNVEAIASKPVPWMAKDAEDQKDIESDRGLPTLPTFQQSTVARCVQYNMYMYTSYIFHTCGGRRPQCCTP
jgi:hypothetical protein